MVVIILMSSIHLILSFPHCVLKFVLYMCLHSFPASNRWLVRSYSKRGNPVRYFRMTKTQPGLQSPCPWGPGS